MSVKSSGYQTLLLSDGSEIPGVFPTGKWFKKIKEHVSFKGKSVLDVGCNNFMMGILSLLNKAKFVTGVEINKDILPMAKELVKHYELEKSCSLLCKPAEELDKRKKYDSVILSMVLHWIEDPKNFLRSLGRRTSSDIVIIFREKNSSYPIPQSGKWFPTVKEIDSLFPKFSRKHMEVILTQDNGKRIILLIYQK